VSTKNNPAIRVLLAVNSREMKTAFFLALNSEPSIEIVGTAVNTAELSTFTRALNPDAILLEWELPGTSLVEILSSIIQAEAELNIFIISNPSTQQQCQSIAQSKSRIFVEDSPETLITLLKTHQQLEEIET